MNITSKFARLEHTSKRRSTVKFKRKSLRILHGFPCVHIFDQATFDHVLIDSSMVSPLISSQLACQENGPAELADVTVGRVDGAHQREKAMSSAAVAATSEVQCE